MKGSLKGSYCKSCHHYFQLRRQPDGSFSGICPKCGKRAHAEAGGGGGTFVQTAAPQKKGEQKRSINVWESYAGGKILGRVQAGTPARLLEERRYNGVQWFRIEAAGLRGWVSSSFIKRA